MVDDVSVTVVIPTRNRADDLAACVDTILESSYPLQTVEVVVVDDGDDGTDDVVATRCDQTAASFVYKTRPLGKADHKEGSVSLRNPASARNVGADLANGEFLLFCDSDVLVDPVWIQKHVEELQNTDATVGDYTAAANDEMTACVRSQVRNERNRRDRYMDAEGGPLTIDARNFGVRKDVFETLGGFDESLSSNEDVDLGLRLAESHSMQYLPEATVSHRYPDTLRALCRRAHWHGIGAGQLLAKYDGSGAFDFGSDRRLFETAQTPLWKTLWDVSRSPPADGWLVASSSLVAYKTGVWRGNRWINWGRARFGNP